MNENRLSDYLHHMEQAAALMWCGTLCKQHCQSYSRNCLPCVWMPTIIIRVFEA